MRFLKFYGLTVREDGIKEVELRGCSLYVTTDIYEHVFEYETDEEAEADYEAFCQALKG